MALSNAERQKRYRERAAAALRNGPAATPSPAVGRGVQTIPAALARFYAAVFESEDIPYIPGDVAGAVAKMWELLEIFTLDHPDVAPIIDALGGREYLEAALAWRHKPKSRKRDKGPAPVPPNLPVT
jgi:hypothetical protein